MMFYRFCLYGAWFLWHLAYRIRVVGRENIVRGRGVVLVCNHQAALDPVFLVISMRLRRPLLIFSKQELFEKNGFISWFLGKAGAIPVRRGRGDTSVLQSALDAVGDGRSVLVFPEGTRSHDGELHALKSGAFLVAAQAGTEIQPCRILYETDWRPRFFKRVTVVFGRPVSCASLGLSPDCTPSELRAAKSQVRAMMEQLRVQNPIL